MPQLRGISQKAEQEKGLLQNRGSPSFILSLVFPVAICTLCSVSEGDILTVEVDAVDGSKLRALREAAGMSQQELADAVYVSRELVSKWETGARSPNRETLDRLAAVLGAEAQALGGDDVFAELDACMPDGTLSAERLTALLDGFLATLGVRDRCVFIRRYYFAEDAPVIGAHYGLGDNHVRTILARTRRKLKKYLEANA